MTEAEIEAEIAKIDAALNSSTTTLTYLGRSVTRSMESLRLRKAELQGMLSGKTVRHVLTYTPGHKGL